MQRAARLLSSRHLDREQGALRFYNFCVLSAATQVESHLRNHENHLHMCAYIPTPSTVKPPAAVSVPAECRGSS